MQIAKMSVVLMVAMVAFVALAYASLPSPNYGISNLSKEKSETARMEIAGNDFSRMRGLMFRDKIVPILFIFNSEGIYPIHSNFVVAPFDAVYLSPNGTVVEMFRKIAPGTQLVTPKKKALYLLELPVEMTDSLSISVGDNISWKKLD